MMQAMRNDSANEVNANIDAPNDEPLTFAVTTVQVSDYEESKGCSVCGEDGAGY